MNELTRKSMIEALSFASLAELPEVWDCKREWKDAIALIEKYDGTEYFAIAKRSEDGEIRIVKDFGSMFAIKGVKQYYPYEFYIRQDDFDKKQESEKEENNDVKEVEIKPIVEELFKDEPLKRTEKRNKV